MPQNDQPGPPKNVRHVSCRKYEAEVVWEAADDNNEPLTGYKVFYHMGFDDSQKKKAASKTLKPSKKYFSVQVTPWSNYTFYVQAFNALGESDMSQPSEACSTPASEPQKNPSGVCVESREPNQLVIVWEHMEKIDHNGENFVYEVEYKRKDIPDSTPNREIITDWEQEELVVSVDEVFKPYEFSVMAKNSIGDKRPVEKWEGYSGEGVPTVSPSNFKIDESTMNGTSAEFTWDPVDTNKDLMKGYFTGYEIHYWPTNDDSKLKVHDIPLEPEKLCKEIEESGRGDTPRRKRATKDEERAHILELWPFTEISAAILAKNTKQLGRLSDPPITFSTPEGLPGRPGNLGVVERGSTHLEVEWEPPAELNGIVKGYQVTYKPKPGGIKARWIVVPLCAIIILVLILIIIWLVTRKKCGGYPVNNEKNAPRDNPFNGQEAKIKGPDVTFHRESSSVVMSSCEKERDSFVSFGKDMPMERNSS